MLGTESYARLKFGIGNDFARGCQIDYVLGQFPDDQKAELAERIKVADEAIREYVLAALRLQCASTIINNQVSYMATEVRIDKWLLGDAYLQDPDNINRSLQEGTHYP